MISPCIPISFIDHFYHEIDVCDVLLLLSLLFKPRCAYFWMLSLLGPALARQENNLYTVERLIQACYDVCIIWVSILS